MTQRTLKMSVFALVAISTVAIAAEQEEVSGGPRTGNRDAEVTGARPAESEGPAVATSPAASPRPAASDQPSSSPSGVRAARRSPEDRPPATGARSAPDRLELDTTVVTGNRELPKVLYIVPWKKADLGDLPGQPFNSLLDEVLTPVDRDVFRREVTYFEAVTESSDATQSTSRPSR